MSLTKDYLETIFRNYSEHLEFQAFELQNLLESHGSAERIFATKGLRDRTFSRMLAQFYQYQAISPQEEFDLKVMKNRSMEAKTNVEILEIQCELQVIEDRFIALEEEIEAIEAKAEKVMNGEQEEQEKEEAGLVYAKEDDGFEDDFWVS